ncbi:MAG: AAA family ATPase [Cyanobacteria bacterium Co-bin8]|nr:AAA family ATPase [Cyanobacteria bacterium Co-bin8]
MLDVIQTNRRCAFCEKGELGVDYLITGPSSFICNECVTNAADLLAARNGHTDIDPTQPLRVGLEPNKFVHTVLKKHFYPTNVTDVVTSSRVFPARMRADLQKALDHLFNQREGVTFLGVHVSYSYETCTFSSLLDDIRETAVIAPARYEEVDIGEDEPVRCLENGLWLVSEHNVRYAVLLSPQKEHSRCVGSHLEVAVLAGTEGQTIVSEIFKQAENAIAQAKSYRGKVLSLETGDNYSGHSVGVTVHRLDPIDQDDLVLPAATIELLRRNVIEFAQRRKELAAFNMPLKKGLLFYGPPGTGKSFTIRYLATLLPGHTTLLVTAEQIGLIREYIALARLLQPSMVVIEDADLIARDRNTMSGSCEEAMLNRLLNEMDGLAEDAELIFILSTNRPETIEAAVAGRPGRIDQAIEFPLPDEAGRKKLATVYARNVPVADDVLNKIAVKTRNVSAAFIKELMRRATQFYLENNRSGSLSIQDIDEALTEMLFTGGQLNVKLLGGDIGSLAERDIS